MRLLKRAAVLPVVALVAAVMPATAARADSYLPGYLTIVSDPGEDIGSGISALWQNPADAITVSGAANTLSITAHDYRFSFGLPSGQTLTPGTTYTAGPASGHPSIFISGDGHSCSDASGSFTVVDLASDAGGITKLDLLYEQHCASHMAALTGEIRLGEPLADGRTIAPTVIHSPDTYPGVKARPVPTYVVNTSSSPLAVGTPTVTGTDAGLFPIVANDCPDTLAAGATCSVQTQFSPTAAGDASATLTVPTGAGNTDTVSLSGTGIAGETSWQMSGDDGIAAGHEYDYTPVNAQFGASGGESVLRFGVADNVRSFSVEFRPGQNDVLREGSTYAVVTGAAGANGPRLYISGRVSCAGPGSFTVNELAVDDFGSITHAAVTFEEYCEGGSGKTVGLIQYRALGAWTAPDGPPGQVTGIEVDGLDGSVGVYWDNPTVADFDHTIVRVAEGLKAPLTTSSGYLLSSDARTGVLLVVDPSQDYAFSIWTVDKAGHVGVRSTALAYGSSLTWDQPSAIVAGAGKVVSGHLVVPSRLPLDHGVVTLYARDHGTTRWKALRSTETDYSGRFTFGVAPRVTTDLMARFVGDSNGAYNDAHTGSTDVTVLQVAPHVTLKASATSVRRGTHVTLTLTSNPVVASLPVTLQKLVGGRWTNVSTGRTSSTGRYAWSVANSAAGTWTYRVVTSETPLHHKTVTANAVYRTT